MHALLNKEINQFFSSLIGYIVIIVFLGINSLFMWILPGNLNILDNGYASIDTLFYIAPWVFLILVPAITMRLFSEEKRTGTIELLFTRPLTDFQIILSKYIAGLVLVVFAILPSLIFFVSAYLLGNPIGIIDVGGTWGSYIGLFFLAAAYVSVGLFTSALTENQIIAFILSVILSFFLYSGFDAVSQLNVVKKSADIIQNLGINEHYRSLSRGVIDSRSLLYFISLIFIFLASTKLVLQSRKW